MLFLLPWLLPRLQILKNFLCYLKTASFFNVNFEHFIKWKYIHPFLIMYHSCYFFIYDNFLHFRFVKTYCVILTLQQILCKHEHLSFRSEYVHWVLITYDACNCIKITDSQFFFSFYILTCSSHFSVRLKYFHLFLIIYDARCFFSQDCFLHYKVAKNFLCHINGPADIM